MWGAGDSYHRISHLRVPTMNWLQLLKPGQPEEWCHHLCSQEHTVLYIQRKSANLYTVEVGARKYWYYQYFYWFIFCQSTNHLSSLCVYLGVSLLVLLHLVCTHLIQTTEVCTCYLKAVIRSCEGAFLNMYLSPVQGRRYKPVLMRDT